MDAFLTLWNGVGDVGASKLAQQLLLDADIEKITEKLENLGVFLTIHC
jgi:DNA helicase-2/ATP-dependent DNA helicase PcrA